MILRACAIERRIRRALTVTLASLAASTTLFGCATASAPAPSTDELRSRIRLSALLLDASDTAAAAFDNEVALALLANASPRELYSYMMSRANATANIRALALGPDPAGALVDLYVYSDLASWACENRVRANPTTPLVPCSATFSVFRAEIVRIAREFMAPDKIATVDAAVAAWKRAHEGQFAVGLIRLGDLADATGTAPIVLAQVAPSMFSPVTEAAQQLEEVRILGYQALWLASRLPTSVGWQLDATAYGIISSGPATQALASASSLDERLAEAHQALARLAESNGDLANRAQGLTDRVGALEAAVATLGTGLASNLGGVSTSVGNLATEARELDGADELATRVVRQATWSGVALITLAATSLGLVLWTHRHHSRRTASKAA
jgi:hypothetical protein